MYVLNAKNSNEIQKLTMQDGNGFIDRKELALMLRFSAETFTNTEIEVILIKSMISLN